MNKIKLILRQQLTIKELDIYTAKKNGKHFSYPKNFVIFKSLKIIVNTKLKKHFKA